MELATSLEAIDEFVDVSSRPRFRDLIPAEDAAELADLLRRAVLFRPASIEPMCRDPSDDFLLALAGTASADVLVSRDDDLLSLQRHGRTDIVHVAEFLRRLHAKA